jgi:hypothetical protein
MNWMQFISSIFGHIVWPLTIIILVILLRDKLSEVLPRLEKVKHKDTEIAFSNAILEVTSQANKSQVKIDDDLSIIEQWLLKMAYLYPNAIISQSYNLVQKEVINLMHMLEPDRKNTLTAVESRAFRNKSGISSEFEDKLRKIKSVHIMAEENSTTRIGIEEVHSYVDLCINMVSEVRNAECNK